MPLTWQPQEGGTLTAESVHGTYRITPRRGGAGGYLIAFGIIHVATVETTEQGKQIASAHEQANAERSCYSPAVAAK